MGPSRRPAPSGARLKVSPSSGHAGMAGACSADAIRVRPADGEQHAAPVAVERDQAADETAKLPQARRRRDQVEGRGVAEERVQGGDRPQCGARGETRVLGAHVVAGELPPRVAEKWDGAAEAGGEAGLEGPEGDGARARTAA